MRISKFESKKPEYCLRILWIEDRVQDWPRKLKLYISKFIEIVYVDGPQAVEALTNDVEYKNILPADIYICDFRLSEGGDGYTPEIHQLVSKAPAAGFLIGMLTAVKWPNVPQVLLPYSGFEDEFGSTFELAKMFCPSSIYLENAVSTSKISDAHTDMIDNGCKSFRKALVNHHKEGKVSLDSQTKKIICDILENGDDLSLEQKLTFKVNHKVRNIFAGALFFDCLPHGISVVNEKVPFKDVLDFAQEFSSDPLSMLARKVSDFYWSMYQQKTSSACYQMLLNKKQAGKELPDNMFFVKNSPAICRLKYQGLDEDEVKTVRRLSILFLYIRFRVFFDMKTELSDTAEDFKSYRSGESKQDIIDALKRKVLDELIGNSSSFDRTYLLEQLDGLLSMLEIDEENIKSTVSIIKSSTVGNSLSVELTRLIQPFPPSSTADTKFSAHTSLGKFLINNLDFHPAKLLDETIEITNYEYEMAREFANEIIPDRASLPKWLGGDHSISSLIFT